jgi:putative transposase
MLFSLLYSLVRRLLGAGGRLQDEQDVEVLVVRHQVKVLQRQVKRPRLNRLDRVFLAAASRAMTRSSWSSFVVRPETLLRWHRELVRKKWTHREDGSPRPAGDRARRPGPHRPPRRENPRWGSQRIRGELTKLEIRISATTVRTILLRAGLDPAPRRAGPTWTPVPEGHRRRGSSRPTSSPSRRSGARRSTSCSSSSSRPGGCTWPVSPRTPTRRGSPEQARNLAIDERLSGVRFLLRDRDATFCGPFDALLRAEGVRVIRTPIRAPRANAFAGRFVRTVRRECLDHLLIYGRRHLERVLKAYLAHYLQERPHRGLRLAVPAGTRAP